MKHRNVFLAGALAVVAASSFAQNDTWRHSGGTPQIDQRQARQEERIQRGIETGRLTSREAMRLQREQREIRRAERMFKSDGVVTAAERAQLVAMLDRADWHIRREMRDENYGRN